MTAEKLCPFKVGDVVFYRPSLRGYGQSVMFGPKGRPEVGQAVKITEMVKGRYVIYEGYDSSAGGIHWEEFSAA